MPSTKQQAYPTTKIKVGAILFSCTAWTDDNGKTSTEINEWIVRSIQVPRGTKSRDGIPRLSFFEPTVYVHITQKLDGLTWVKRSTRIGDYGWRKSIPEWCRKQFAVGRDLPIGIYTTVIAAVLHEITSTEDMIAGSKAPGGFPLDDQETREAEAQLGALQRRYKKLTAAPKGNATAKPSRHQQNEEKAQQPTA